jgi:hypothetical protein
MPDISKIVTPDNTEYNIKDATAREQIAALQGANIWLGITTTPLSDGSTTSTIIINGESVSVTKAGSTCGYNNKEFIWNGTAWQEFGDLSGLGDLAYKNSAQTNYTPSGTINQQGASVSPSTTSITGMATVGTLPTFTVTGETLTFTAGSLPTKSAAIQAITGVTVNVDQAQFTGTQSTIVVS